MESIIKIRVKGASRKLLKKFRKVFHEDITYITMVGGELCNFDLEYCTLLLSSEDDEVTFIHNKVLAGSNTLVVPTDEFVEIEIA